MSTIKNRERSLTPTPKSNVEIRQKSPKPDQTFNTKFYNRFYKQQQTFQLLQLQIDKEIKLLANSKKITEKSYRIIAQKLEEKIQNAILQCNIQKYISFEQMGRLMFILDMFDVIEFNDQFRLNTTAKFFSKSSIIQDQRIKEMNLHEDLWNLLQQQEDQELVQVESVTNLLRILMDPVQLGSQDTTELLYECLNSRSQQSQSRVKTHESFDRIDQGLKKKLKQIIDNYRFVTLNKKFDRSDNSKKEDRLLVIKQNIDKELTFKPQLNPISKHIDQLNMDKMMKEDKQSFHDQSNQLSSALFGDDTPGEITIEAKRQNRVQMLMKKKAQQEQWIEQQQKLKEDEEMRECTFYPQTNNISTDDSIYSTSTLREKSIVQRLYPQEAIQNKRQYLDEVEKMRSDHDNLKELEQCSFQPKINDSILNHHQETQIPKDYDRTVGRLRYAQEQQQKKKDQLQYIPAGQGYEKVKSMPFKPPQMVNRLHMKRKPIMIMDINVAPGRLKINLMINRSGRIALYPGENAKQVAHNFAKMFTLNKVMEETVLNVLIQQQQIFSENNSVYE